MTLFAAALRLLGLSHREAADFLNVRLDTVKSWSAGRNGVPNGVWSQMRALYQEQQAVFDAALELIEQKQPDEIAPSMRGPRSKSWPCPGAQMAVAAAIALSVDIPVREPD